MSGSREVNYTPREWYDLWFLAKDRYAEDEENYWQRKKRLTAKLIAAQDEKFRESKEKASTLERKKKLRLKEKKQRIGNHYTEYVRTVLADEKSPDKKDKGGLGKVAASKKGPENAERRNIFSFSLGESWEDTTSHAASQFYSSGMPAAFKSSIGGEISEVAEEEIESGEGFASRHRDTILHTPDLKPGEAAAYWDPSSVESQAKYTNIITNRALPEHIKAILSRTFGPFLANYYINPHAPAIRFQGRPRVELRRFAGEQRGARFLWRKLRTESNRGVESLGQRVVSKEAAKAFSSYLVEAKMNDQPIPKLYNPYSKIQEWQKYDKLPKLDATDFKGKKNQDEVNMSKLMSELHEDNFVLLSHNNEAMLNSLDLQLEGAETVDFIPFLFSVREEEESKEAWREKLSKMPEESPGFAVKKTNTNYKMNPTMTKQLGAAKLKFMPNEDISRMNPRFSKKFAYTAAVNPVQHVKKEPSTLSIFSGKEMVPERIDLSRMALCEPGGDTENVDLTSMRGVIHGASHNQGQSVEASGGHLKLWKGGDNEVERLRKEKSMEQHGGRIGVNQWAPLSLAALSEYTPVAKVAQGSLNQHRTVNYLDSFQIQQSIT